MPARRSTHPRAFLLLLLVFVVCCSAPKSVAFALLTGGNPARAPVTARQRYSAPSAASPITVLGCTVKLVRLSFVPA